MAFHWEKLEEALQSAGCLPGKLKLVLITHGDRDHIGNCANLQEKYHAPVAMHGSDAFMAETGVFLKRKVRTLKAKIHILLARWRSRKMVIPKFKPDILLKDGQNLQEYGFNAKVVHIPGHTKGSIGILTGEGELFAGDMFVNSKKPDIAIYVDSFPELKHSIDKLTKLHIKKVYPGHGKMFLFSDLKLKI